MLRNTIQFRSNTHTHTHQIVLHINTHTHKEIDARTHAFVQRSGIGLGSKNDFQNGFEVAAAASPFVAGFVDASFIELISAVFLEFITFLFPDDDSRRRPMIVCIDSTLESSTLLDDVLIGRCAQCCFCCCCSVWMECLTHLCRGVLVDNAAAIDGLTKLIPLVVMLAVIDIIVPFRILEHYPRIDCQCPVMVIERFQSKLNKANTAERDIRTSTVQSRQRRGFKN